MDPTKCSVRSCQNPKNSDYKMCKRCQDTQARQSVKKRERKRAEREANGETTRKRAPNRPKPPLFWIRSQGAAGTLYTRRDWEHLDKSIFSNDPDSDDLYGPAGKDVIELIPIKICSSKSCHQPLPTAYPLKACGFCRRPNSKSKAVAGVKRKRYESEGEELLNKVGDIARALLSDVLETKISLLEELTELVEDNEDPFSEDPELWGKLISAPSPLIEALGNSNTLVQIQALILLDHASLICSFTFRSELTAAIPRIIELLSIRPTRYYASKVISKFSLDGLGYHREIAPSVPLLIALLEDSSFDWEYVIDTLLSLARTSSDYCREIAPVIPRLKFFLVEPGFDSKNLVIPLLRTLSNQPELRCDIASIIPRIIELMQDVSIPPYQPLCFLFDFCDDQNYTRDVAHALPRLVEILKVSVYDDDGYSIDCLEKAIFILARLSKNFAYRDEIFLAIRRLIELWKENELSYDGLTYIEEVVANLSYDGKYREELSSIIPSYMTLWRETDGDVSEEILEVLTNLSKPGSFHSDIAPSAIPIIIERLRLEYKPYFVTYASRLLSNFSGYHIYHDASAKALPIVIRFLINRNPSLDYKAALTFISNLCGHPPSIDKIAQVIPRIIELLEDYDIGAQEEAANSLYVLSEQGLYVYTNAIAWKLPNIVKLVTANGANSRPLASGLLDKLTRVRKLIEERGRFYNF